MDRLTAALGGISGILVTPLDADDAIAPRRLAPIVERAVGAGVHILGNTGEFYSLTTDEAAAMAAAAAELVAGRAPLLCGIGRALPDAVRLARAARAAGADGLMVHQPPDPFAAPRGVVDYVRRVAEAGEGLPLVLYLRNDAVGTAAIADLCAVEGVVAVKWATPNPMRMAEAMTAADPRIVWVAGLAETWAPVLCAVGARGFSSGLINVWPERSMQIHAALDAGDYARANALKTRFLATVSHEVRTPLNGVLGMASVVLDGHLDGETRHYVGIIRTSGYHMLDVINRILDFSKLDHTPRGDDISEFDLRAVVEEVLEEARFLPYADGLELRADLEAELQSRRKGYRQGLRQVLTNLVGNGAKFTAKGSVTVHIVGRPEDAVRVEVRDTGAGITPSDLERIFLPYEQAERSTPGSHGGTGLGLAICAEVVRRMGGTIGVESLVGAGSLFWFEVPLPIVTVSEAMSEVDQG